MAKACLAPPPHGAHEPLPRVPEAISSREPYRGLVGGEEGHPVSLEHLVMALDRTLTTLDPGRGAQRMAADVRQALTEALAALASTRRSLGPRGGPSSTGGGEDFLQEIEEVATWLRSYVRTFTDVPGTERFSVEVPYLKIKGLRDRALERRLRWVPPAQASPSPAVPGTRAPTRASARGGTPPRPRRPRSGRRSKAA